MTVSTSYLSPNNPTTSTSAADGSLYAKADEKLRELVQQGNLDAIALALKLQPQKVEVTCQYHYEIVELISPPQSTVTAVDTKTKKGKHEK